MSRPLKLTEELANLCRAKFEEALSSTKTIDGGISFSFKLENKSSERATIYYTPTAWFKMTTLVQNFSSEVAWHGIAERCSEDMDPNGYIISDVVVYPQTVTGVTVEMDMDEYPKWMMENISAGKFESLHMQGHSHVDMKTISSGTDKKHQDDIVETLKDDSFYIFQIWNKSYSSESKIYDMKKNIYFEPEDIDVKLIGCDVSLAEFIKEAKDIVKSKSYSATKDKDKEPKTCAATREFRGGAWNLYDDDEWYGERSTKKVSSFDSSWKYQK